MSQLEIDIPIQDANMGPFPYEIWLIILAFLMPHEEFPVALVCRTFYKILSRQRAKRGESKWQTVLTPFCRTPKLIWFVENTCPASCDTYIWGNVSKLIPSVLAKQQNYGILLELVRYGDYFDGLYDTLIEQGAFDVVRKLLKIGVKTSRDFVKPAIKSGQLDLVKTAYNDRDLRYILDIEDFWNAIKTGNIDIVKLIYKICISFGWERFYSMDSFVRTGKLEIVKFAHETMKLTPCHMAFKKALQHKYIDIIEYLLEIKCPIDYEDIWLCNLKKSHPSLAAKIEVRIMEALSALDDDFW